MKNLIQSLLLLGSLVTLLALSSCKKDEPTPTPTPAFNGFTIGSQKYPISKGWYFPDEDDVFVIFASNTISDNLTGTGNILFGYFSRAENSDTLNTGIYALSSSENPMTCDGFEVWLNSSLFDDVPNYSVEPVWNTNKTVSVAKESNKYVLTFSGLVAKDLNDVSATTSANIKVPLRLYEGSHLGSKSSDMGLNDNQFHALRQKLQKFRQRATQR